MKTAANDLFAGPTRFIICLFDFCQPNTLIHHREKVMGPIKIRHPSYFPAQFP